MFTLKDLQEYLKENTDIYVGYETINRWKRKGLLGDVPIREGGTWADYEPVKERAFLVAVLRGYGWSERKVKRLLELPVEESEREVRTMVEKIETTVLPRFKQIILDRWSEVVGVKKEVVENAL